jgi:hypothetical protein
MTAFPNFPPREVIDRLIDTVTWAKTCLLICAATRPDSPERVDELKKLRDAVVEPRSLVSKAFSAGQSLPSAILITLRTCELAIPRLEAGAVLQPSFKTSGETP